MSSDNIIIRKANESDLKEIMALIGSPTIDNGKTMELSDANAVYQSILSDFNYFQMVASSERGIIGVISLVIIMQLTHEGSTTAFISDLIIAPNKNSSEIASQLIQHASKLAREYGCYKTVIHSDYQNELLTSTCQDLGFEQTIPGFVLPE
jgi:N-acetylglutamate synthase-like GNAT family acetyltransferase